MQNSGTASDRENQAMDREGTEMGNKSNVLPRVMIWEDRKSQERRTRREECLTKLQAWQ